MAFYSLFFRVNVRLGEYDTTTIRDCLEGNCDCQNKPDDCNDPVLNVGIEEIISHQNYNTPRRRNDIGLIRLNQDVTYTRYIKPMCLPSTLRASRSVPTTNVSVAGWGKTLDGMF